MLNIGGTQAKKKYVVFFIIIIIAYLSGDLLIEVNDFKKRGNYTNIKSNFSIHWQAKLIE